MNAKKSFFAKQLRKIMFEKNITQEDLGNMIGVNRQMISYWITSGKNPSLNSINKISAALKVPAGYFLENINIDDKKDNAKNNERDIQILQLKNEILELKLKISELENFVKEKLK